MNVRTIFFGLFNRVFYAAGDFENGVWACLASGSQLGVQAYLAAVQVKADVVGFVEVRGFAKEARVKLFEFRQVLTGDDDGAEGGNHFSFLMQLRILDDTCNMDIF